MPRSGPRRGIALREVIVVAVLTIFLLMLLVMWLGRTRGDSHRLVCERRQQQTAAAMMQFEVLHEHYPGYKNLQAEDAQGQRQPTGWAFSLLPFLGSYVPDLELMGPAEIRKLAEDADPILHYESIFREHGPLGIEAVRGTIPQRRISEVICTADPSIGEGDSENVMSWVVNTGLPDAENYEEFPADWAANGIFQNQFDPGASMPPTIGAAWVAQRDGLSTTLMLTENVDAGEWTDYEEAQVGFVWVAEVDKGFPTRGERLLGINEAVGQGDGGIRFARPSSYHEGGANALFASGRTQFLSQDIDYLVFARLLTSDGANAKVPGTQTPVPEVFR